MSRSPGTETAEEGCLSIPEIFGEVERAQTVELEALDRDGRPYRATLSGFKARAAQHEIEHLDGVLFLDHPSAVPRGLLLAQAPPVKVAAVAEGIPVLQPARPTDRAFVDRLRMLAPDVGVVVAYGHILKPELLALPGHGMVNVHPSLLPELRGAAPVEWAILNG